MVYTGLYLYKCEFKTVGHEPGWSTNNKVAFQNADKCIKIKMKPFGM